MERYPEYQDYLIGVDSSAIDALVKQEPLQELGQASASVPIPGGHRGTRGIYDQFSPSPLTNPSTWGIRLDQMDSPFKVDSDLLESCLKMEDDDIFQVDKADLIQGPTLAELNANDDTLLGDLNFDDLLLPEQRIDPSKAVENPAASSSLFGGAGPIFGGPSSFPQSTQIFHRNCPSYASNTGFNINGGINMIDSPGPVSPSFQSPETSNVAGQTFENLFFHLFISLLFFCLKYEYNK